MAAYYPQSSASLLTISGVGQVKLRQYGDAFLEIIKAYSDKHGLKEKRKEAPR
jgi:ATP-dependent DNA helicase RecQ